MADGVPRVVFPQSPQQDQRHEAHEEQHHHEAVKNAEPVDLVLEEGVVEVAVEAGVEGGAGDMRRNERKTD